MTTGQTCITGAVWTALVSAAVQCSTLLTGRGFTVVADEVLELSNRTTRFSAQSADATLDAIGEFAHSAPANPKQGVARGEVELF